MASKDVRTSVKVLDVPAARRYLRGVRSLAHEAAESSEPQVLLLALEVLRLAPRTIDGLFRRAA